MKHKIETADRVHAIKLNDLEIELLSAALNPNGEWILSAQESSVRATLAASFQGIVRDCDLRTL